MFQNRDVWKSTGYKFGRMVPFHSSKIRLHIFSGEVVKLIYKIFEKNFSYKRNPRNLILEGLFVRHLMLSFSPILAGRRNWMHCFHRPSKMRLLIFHLHARQCFSRCKLDCFILVFIFKIGQIKLPKFLRHLLGTITLNWSLASPNRAPSWTQTFERLSSTATSSTAS